MRHDVPLKNLACTFLRLGATSFGGSMLPLMEDAVVQKKGWLSPEKFSEGIALAQLVPGPIALKVAAHVGLHLRGPLGMTLASASFALPSFLLIALIGTLFFRFGQSLALERTTRFLTSVVAALLLATSWRMARQNLRCPSQWLLVGIAFLALKGTTSPMFVLWAFGLGGIVWHGVLKNLLWKTPSV